ncbi:hypothetical protein R1flu_006597 [Riccia fluitans]|uniref:Uncharacterized protein n=1 Tax=Riccia fluitans TaxID=41844 RepID=A0ABD1YWG3_9MARC
MQLKVKFDMKMKTRRAIDRKFEHGKSGTNGYPMMQYKDLFKRTITMVLMVLMRPHRMTYMSAHQVAFVEAIVQHRPASWEGIFHWYSQDMIKIIAQQKVQLGQAKVSTSGGEIAKIQDKLGQVIDQLKHKEDDQNAEIDQVKAKLGAKEQEAQT